MQKLNRGIAQMGSAVKTKFGKFKALCSTALALSMVSPLVAQAQSAASLGSAAEAQISGAEAIILGLLVTLVGIVFLFVLYSLIKKAK